MSILYTFVQQVNNAGVSGTIIDPEAFKAASAGMGKDDVEVSWNEILTETYDLAEECPFLFCSYLIHQELLLLFLSWEHCKYELSSIKWGI